MNMWRRIGLTGLSVLLVLLVLVAPAARWGSLVAGASGQPERLLSPQILVSGRQVTNLRDTVVTITWVTDVPAIGQVRFGTTTALGTTAEDDRGAGVVAQTHSVLLTPLAANTKYYYDIVLNNGAQVDNNGDQASYYLNLTALPEQTWLMLQLAEPGAPLARPG